MKKFIYKEMEDTIKTFIKQLIGYNLLIIGIAVFFDYISDPGDFLLNTKTFGLLMLGTLNVSFSLAFLLRYYTEWLPPIREEYKQIRLGDKYSFYKKRFDQQ